MEFRVAAGCVEAVSGVSFEVGRDETVAVVGESGSGKTVTALSVLRLLDGGRITGGRIHWEDRELTALDEAQMRRIRGQEIAMIFQDPMTSLDPLYSVGSQVVEAIRLHRGLSRRAARVRAGELLDQVGLPDPISRLRSYPHQLSGGQRQRVMIAMALACSPRLLIADEPTTALDVTVEAQILELIRDLQRQYQTSLLLVTHDMGVVAEMADRVVVFYAGQIVEQGTVTQVLADPRHPYTEALLEGIPAPTTDRATPLTAIPGVVPSLREMPPGCRFHPRCRYAWQRCEEHEAPLFDVGDGRDSRCWLATRADQGLTTGGEVR